MGLVLTVSQRFEDGPQEFCGAEAYHGVEFWVRGGENREPSLPGTFIVCEVETCGHHPGFPSYQRLKWGHAGWQNSESAISSNTQPTIGNKIRRGKKLTKGPITTAPKEPFPPLDFFSSCDRSLGLSRDRHQWMFLRPSRHKVQGPLEGKGGVPRGSLA